jgi:hypothetical protein
MNTYFVIDSQDNLVLYAGTQEECELVQHTQYAGLLIYAWDDLNDQQKADVESRFANKIAGLR